MTRFTIGVFKETLLDSIYETFIGSFQMSLVTVFLSELDIWRHKKRTDDVKDLFWATITLHYRIHSMVLYKAVYYYFVQRTEHSIEII